MSTHHEDEQVLHDAQAAIAAAQIRQAITDDVMTFTDYPAVQTREILDSLPAADELTVPTSVRLPMALHTRLRAYADAHQTTASALLREWVEQMLTVSDRPISLADAVRVLSTLPTQDQHRAA